MKTRDRDMEEARGVSGMEVVYDYINGGIIFDEVNDSHYWLSEEGPSSLGTNDDIIPNFNHTFTLYK